LKGFGWSKEFENVSSFTTVSLSLNLDAAFLLPTNTEAPKNPKVFGP
jgi:hypothetical protein